VAEHGSVIVGVEGRVPLKIKIGNDLFDCEQRCDLAVHPDHRGKGLFKKMHSSLNDSSKKAGIKFSYAIEGNPIVINQMKKAGAKTFEKKVKNFLYIRDVRKFLKRNEKKPLFLYKIILDMHKSLNKLRYTLSPNKMGKKTLVVTDVEYFEGRFDDFWMRVSKDYDYILVKDSPYLNWRYRDSRAGSYVVKVALESSEIIGYIVLSINRYEKEYPTGHIVDMLTLSGYEYIIASLLEESMKFFITEDVYLVNCWLIEDHPYIKYLKSYSFLDLNQQVLFTFLLYNIDELSFNNIIGKNSRIYVSMADSDHI
jgi:GNAT superfamily N-acetyltransferase